MVTILQKAVGADGACRRRDRDLAAQPALQQPGAGHMVGMDVGLQCPAKREAEFGDQCRVAPHLFEDRIDQYRLAAHTVPQEVGIGRRRWIEELTKDEHWLPFPFPRLRPRQAGALALSMAAIDWA